MPRSKNTVAPVNIARSCYTMATLNGSDAEINMYGDIVESRPIDWWTGEPIAGDFIILSEFLDDLNTLASASTLTIHMNSAGGDSFSAISIHNRLRELKAKKTCIVDGVAMSGGSLIMCAADVVRVNPSSLVMIHKCWGRLWGGYNADQLRELAVSYDAVDKAQAAIYKRKCGLDEETILSMMSDTTYLTGKEAVDKGFADELTDDTPIEVAASADRKKIYAGGRMIRLPDSEQLPESISIPIFTSDNLSNGINSTPVTAGSEGGSRTMTLEELRTQNPELVEQIEASARAAASADTAALDQARADERSRMSAIDEIAMLYDDETVHEAKYGEHPCTAQEMAFRAAQKAAKTGSAFMAAVASDYKASGVDGVTGQPAPEDSPKAASHEELMNEARANTKALLHKEEKNG